MRKVTKECNTQEIGRSRNGMKQERNKKLCSKICIHNRTRIFVMGVGRRPQGRRKKGGGR